MAIEKHMLQTHSVFEKSVEVFEGVAKLKEKIADLEKENGELKDKCERRTRTALMWKRKYEELLK